ncbi:MAG: TatD family hydrolase [Ghiorsea sp.]
MTKESAPTSTWIDSHCHLDDPCFEQTLVQTLNRARKLGITQLIIPGIQQQNWGNQLAIQQKYEGIHNAFGIHPWYCHLHSAADLSTLESLLPQAVALGECGLDFMPNRPDKSLQIYWFQAQLELAQQYKLPVIMHSVKSTDTMLTVLKKYPQITGVIHGFSGSKEQATRFTDLGFYIGLGTRACRAPSKKVESLIASLPMERILLETDAPFGLKYGETNTPCQLIDVAKKVATLRNQDVHTILTTCSLNAKELFQ